MAVDKRPVERPAPVIEQDLSSQELDFPVDKKRPYERPVPAGRDRQPAGGKGPRRATPGGGAARPLVMPSASEAVDLDSPEAVDAPDLPDLYADSGEQLTLSLSLSRGRQAARASQRDSSPGGAVGGREGPEAVEAPGTQRRRGAAHVGLLQSVAVLIDRDSAETREILDTQSMSNGGGAAFSQVQFRKRRRSFQLSAATTTSPSTANNNNNNNNSSAKGENPAPVSVLTVAVPYAGESNTTTVGDVEVEADSVEETQSPQHHNGVGGPFTARMVMTSGTTVNDLDSAENLRDNSTEKHKKNGDTYETT
ncbi:hypothetical protein ACEWY4_019428 [Coilia grayii]|uniref:Uncharacterized protein n=1 Tax=Coilia grayii TaxID=363190 RepID=A0ABD1JC58_9TELE